MERKVQVEPLFYLLMAVACLLIPLRLLFAWITAVCVHELCHIFALKLVKCRIRRVSIGINGTLIYTEELMPWQELVCAAAGPVGSLSLLLLIRWMPLVALCGALQGLYNLLPVSGMDGGRVLWGLLKYFVSAAVANRIQRVIHWCVMAVLLALGVYCLLVLPIGPLPFLFVVFLILRSGKIPCKTFAEQVQ